MKLLMYEGSAGFSSYTHKLCNALCEVSEDVEIFYITTRDNKEILGLNERVTLVPVLKDYDESNKNSIRWFINRVYVSIYNIIRRNMMCRVCRYDVISIQFTIPIFDQFLIKKICKKYNVYYTAHDVIPPNKSRFWSMASLHSIYSLVPQIVVHTYGNKKQLETHFGVDEGKISVIHHGMENDYIKRTKEQCLHKLGIDSDNEFILLFYGAIREQKGLDDLIIALRDVDNAHLIIAGAMPYGESFDRYDHLIQENQVKVTKIIEYVPFELTEYLFQACDVVCLPYKYFYSQSGVFMQSIQYRKPVIVSDVSSFGEYITKYKIGILCNPDDSIDLHNKIIEMKSLIMQNSDIFNIGLEKAAIENSWYESAVKHLKVFSEKGHVDDQ